MYYFMEDLPYIPSEMQAQWFDIEVSMLQRAIESAERLLQAYSEVDAKSNEFLETSNMYRISLLRRLSILNEQKPGSLEYNNMLKIERNYNYDQYTYGLSLEGKPHSNMKKWLEKFQERKITSDESFEMSRDYLYPTIDFNFETQNEMKKNPLRKALLKPHLERFNDLSKELGDRYYEIRGIHSLP